jgi:hypothetical protein
VDKIFDHILDNLVLADLWEEIIKRVLDALQGADLWIALLFLAAGYVCWRWIGAGQEEQPVLRRRLGAGAILAVLAGAAIGVNHAFFQREPVFSKDHTGILVMRIEGDDAQNSLQGALVDKLNADLQKESVGQPIEVHEGREIIDQSNGIDAAHTAAKG